MLVCEARVTTLCACALVNTRPCAARRSSTGVWDLGLPENPGASARRVLMVIRTMSRDAADGADAADGRGFGGGAAAAAITTPASAATAAKLHVFIRRGIVAGGRTRVRRGRDVHRRRTPARQGGIPVAQGVNPGWVGVRATFFEALHLRLFEACTSACWATIRTA